MRERARERDALDGLVSCRVYVVVVAASAVAAVNIFGARTFDDDDDSDGGGQRWGVLGIVYILLWWRVGELLRLKMCVAHVYFSRSGCEAMMMMRLYRNARVRFFIVCNDVMQLLQHARFLKRHGFCIVFDEIYGHAKRS